jgi:hypothetical protein
MPLSPLNEKGVYFIIKNLLYSSKRFSITSLFKGTRWRLFAGGGFEETPLHLHTRAREAVGVGLPSVQALAKDEVGGMKTCTENWKNHRLYI